MDVRMSKMGGRLLLCAVLMMSFGVSCQRDKPKVIYMPDMVYSPALKAQEPGAMRLPVEGTVPRGFQPYAFPDDPERAGKELRNPLPRTSQVLARGQFVFKNYCIVCHGKKGEGDGDIIPKFSRPPSLHSDKLREWTDGRIFHVITAGQNLMPSYASQIKEGDRWAAIHYIRTLQRAKNPSAEDLKFAEGDSE